VKYVNGNRPMIEQVTLITSFSLFSCPIGRTEASDKKVSKSQGEKRRLLRTESKPRYTLIVCPSTNAQDNKQRDFACFSSIACFSPRFVALLL